MAILIVARRCLLHDKSVATSVCAGGAHCLSWWLELVAQYHTDNCTQDALNNCVVSLLILVLLLSTPDQFSHIVQPMAEFHIFCLMHNPHII